MTQTKLVNGERIVMSQEEIDAKLADESALKAKRDATEWEQKRKEAYPPMADYLDAVVKGDNDALLAYKDACLAVKATYPKPKDNT